MYVVPVLNAVCSIKCLSPPLFQVKNVATFMVMSRLNISLRIFTYTFCGFEYSGNGSSGQKLYSEKSPSVE